MSNKFDTLKLWVKENSLFTCLIIFIICLKIPMLGFPLYWDAPAYNDLRLIEGDAIKFFMPWNTESLGLNNHPNGLQFILYFFYQILGNNVVTLHVLALSLSLLMLFSYYEVIKMYYEKTTAIICTILIFLSPIFFAQSTQFLPDIPTIGISVFSFYLYKKKNYRYFLPVGLLAGLMSESGLAFSMALIMIAGFNWLKKRITWQEYLISFIPISSLLYYFIKQKIITGKLIKHPAILQREANSNFSWLDLNGENIYVLKMMKEFILHNSNSILILLVPLSLIVVILKRRKMFNEGFVYFFISSFLYFGFFFIYGDYHPRNIFPVYNFIFILMGLLFANLKEFKHNLFKITFFTTCIILVTQSFKPMHTGDAIYSSYVDEVTLCQDTFQYISKAKLKGPFYATFPIAYFFEDVGSGYVNEPMEINVYYADGQWNKKGRKKSNTIVMTNIEGAHTHKQVHNYIEKNNFRLIKLIERGRAKSWIFNRAKAIDNNEQ